MPKGSIHYPDFPDEVFSLPTMNVGVHRVQFIAQGDDDDRKAQFVNMAIERKRQDDRIKYPGLYDRE